MRCFPLERCFSVEFTLYFVVLSVALILRELFASVRSFCFNSSCFSTQDHNRKRILENPSLSDSDRNYIYLVENALISTQLITVETTIELSSSSV